MRFGLVVACTLALSMWSAAAFADGGMNACEESNVKIEGTANERWSEALAHVCADVAAIRDRDPEAITRVIANGDDVTIEVTLSDGRTARRSVQAPYALRGALEALLVLPPPPPEPAPAAPVAVPPAPPPDAREKVAPSSVESMPVSASPGSPRRTAELSIGTAARVAGAGILSVAPTAEASLFVGDWMLGLSARWEVVQSATAPRAHDFERDSAGAGLVVARRIGARGFDLDLGLSPRLVVETQSHEIDEEDENLSATDVRLGAFTRVTLGRGPIRPFAMFDMEVSPARLRRNVRLASQLPALPAWGAGLSLGLSWTTP